MNGSLGARIAASPGFRAFVAILGSRIRNGRTIDAQRMLQDIGFPGALGHEVIDGWPSADAPRGKVVPLLRAGISLPAIEGLWLGSFVDDIRNYDWPMLLVRATSRAAAAANADSDSGSAAPDPKRGA